jgi:hypothetical protein
VSEHIAESDIARAEYILRSCFEHQLLAGDQRGIHERLERILPAGAYALCGLTRQQLQPSGSSGYYSSRQRPYQNQRPRAPNRQQPYNRRDSRGASSRETFSLLDSPSTHKYLDPTQQAALKQLQLEKEKRDLAAQFAKSSTAQIKEEEKRLEEAAQLNLEQEALDRRRERLSRPPTTARIPKLINKLKDLGLATASEEEGLKEAPQRAIKDGSAPKQ